MFEYPIQEGHMEAAISYDVGQHLCAAKETQGFCPLLFQGFAKCKGLQGTSNDLNRSTIAALTGTWLVHITFWDTIWAIIDCRRYAVSWETEWEPTALGLEVVCTSQDPEALNTHTAVNHCPSPNTPTWQKNLTTILSLAVLSQTLLIISCCTTVGGCHICTPTCLIWASWDYENSCMSVACTHIVNSAAVHSGALAGVEWAPGPLHHTWLVLSKQEELLEFTEPSKHHCRRRGGIDKGLLICLAVRWRGIL